MIFQHRKFYGKFLTTLPKSYFFFLFFRSLTNNLSHRCDNAITFSFSVLISFSILFFFSYAVLSEVDMLRERILSTFVKCDALCFVHNTYLKFKIVLQHRNVQHLNFCSRHFFFIIPKREKSFVTNLSIPTQLFLLRFCYWYGLSSIFK